MERKEVKPDVDATAARAKLWPEAHGEFEEMNLRGLQVNSVISAAFATMSKSATAAAGKDGGEGQA